MRPTTSMKSGVVAYRMASPRSTMRPGNSLRTSANQLAPTTRDADAMSSATRRIAPAHQQHQKREQFVRPVAARRLDAPRVVDRRADGAEDAERRPQQDDGADD